MKVMPTTLPRKQQQTGTVWESNCQPHWSLDNLLDLLSSPPPISCSFSLHFLMRLHRLTSPPLPRTKNTLIPSSIVFQSLSLSSAGSASFPPPLSLAACLRGAAAAQAAPALVPFGHVLNQGPPPPPSPLSVRAS